MSVVNLGNVVGLIKSPTAPTKKYVLWFKWDNYPTTPEDGDLYYYDYNSSSWEILVIDTGGGSTTYIRPDPIKITVGGLVKDIYTPNGSIQDLLDDMLYPIIEPTATFSIGGLPFEKGLNINPVPLNYLVTPNDKTISTRQLFKNATVLNSPSGNSGTFNYTGGLQFSQTLLNRTFKFYVLFSDASTLIVSQVANFEAPTYYGSLAIGSINETGIKTLTKQIWSKQDRDNLSFSPTLQRFVFAYPKSFGLLSSIIDPNNFDILPEFTLIEFSGGSAFLLADGVNSEDYYVYRSNDNTTQSAFLLDFKF